ncbi:MAG: hypothetical protein QXI43_00095 [Candidatus Nitrosocaldus sp.]
MKSKTDSNKDEDNPSSPSSLPSLNTIRLLDASLAILRSLFLFGPQNKIFLVKDWPTTTGTGTGTTFKKKRMYYHSLKYLLKYQYIISSTKKEKEKEKGEEGGDDNRYYHITPRGIFAVLTAEPSLINQLPNIIQQHQRISDNLKSMLSNLQDLINELQQLNMLIPEERIKYSNKVAEAFIRQIDMEMYDHGVQLQGLYERTKILNDNNKNRGEKGGEGRG